MPGKRGAVSIPVQLIRRGAGSGRPQRLPEGIEERGEAFREFIPLVEVFGCQRPECQDGVGKGPDIRRIFYKANVRQVLYPFVLP